MKSDIRLTCIAFSAAVFSSSFVSSASDDMLRLPNPGEAPVSVNEHVQFSQLFHVIDLDIETYIIYHYTKAA